MGCVFVFGGGLLASCPGFSERQVSAAARRRPPGLRVQEGG